MQEISLEKMSDILEVSKILNTLSTTGMLCHVIEHPTLGKAHVIQSDSNCLLILAL